MNMTGKLFTRIATTMTMVLLALVIALPLNASVLAAAAFNPDDFNRCTPDPWAWDTGVPQALRNARISDPFTANAALEISIPANTVATFSNTNKDAPRLLQPATDSDFELEVKFDSPLGKMTGSNWNIQGILIRDANANRWLRVDLNSNSTSINYYVGYIDENGTLHDVRGPAVISSTWVNEAPLYLRIKYEKALNRWSVGYQISDKLNPGYRTPFLETDPLPGLPNGFSLNVTHIGVFAGATGSTTRPAFTSKVDYIKSIPDAFTDDAFTLTVTKVGAGEVTQQCSGNQVTLTASPASGSSFSGWTGDFVGAQATIQLLMNRSYNVIANFTNGEPVEQPFKFYFPMILR